MLNTSNKLKKSLYFISFLLLGLLFSACSVKQSDSTLTKAVKHTINTPAYAVLGVGMLGTMAGGTVGYATSKSIDKMIGVELYVGESYLGKMEQKSIDTNESLCMFYDNDYFRMYKDIQNTTYLFIKKDKDFIKNVSVPSKRWATATFERRPALRVTKITLKQTGLDKEYVLSKMTKDRFGNPIGLGTNTFLNIQQERYGLALEKYTHLYLIDGGAHESGIINTDKNLPSGFDNQIEYYFPSVESIKLKN